MDARTTGMPRRRSRMPALAFSFSAPLLLALAVLLPQQGRVGRAGFGAFAVVDAAAATGKASGAYAYHRYIVVGAGPGGLQIAHYLDSAGRDYLVLEKVRARMAASSSSITDDGTCDLGMRGRDIKSCMCCASNAVSGNGTE